MHCACSMKQIDRNSVTKKMAGEHFARIHCAGNVSFFLLLLLFT